MRRQSIIRFAQKKYQGWNGALHPSLDLHRGGALRAKSRDVENGLESLDKSPFFHGDISTVELLQCVDTGTRDVRDQLILLLEMTSVHGLVGALDLDGDGRLTTLANGDGLVIALNGGTVDD